MVLNLGLQPLGGVEQPFHKYIVAYSFNKLTKSACLTYQETMYGKEQKLYSEELENSKTF